MKFGEIVDALVMQRFLHGYSRGIEDQWVKDASGILHVVGSEIAVEPFRCAEQLFYEGERKDKTEEFPFGGCGGKDTESCSISKYKVRNLLKTANGLLGYPRAHSSSNSSRQVFESIPLANSPK